MHILMKFMYLKKYIFYFIFISKVYDSLKLTDEDFVELELISLPKVNFSFNSIVGYFYYSKDNKTNP